MSQEAKYCFAGGEFISYKDGILQMKVAEENIHFKKDDFCVGAYVRTPRGHIGRITGLSPDYMYVTVGSREGTWPYGNMVLATEEETLEEKKREWLILSANQRVPGVLGLILT